MRRVKMVGIPKTLAGVFAAYAESRGEDLATFAAKAMASEIRRHARGARRDRWIAVLTAAEDDALERFLSREHERPPAGGTLRDVFDQTATSDTPHFAHRS